MSWASADAARPTPRWSPIAAWVVERERALFAASVLALIVPLWLFAHFPSTDGPVHLDIAQILRDYGAPSAGPYRDHFVLNPNVEPNVTAHHLLAQLGRVMDLPTAEKVLLSVIILVLAWGARTAVHAVSPTAGPFAFLFLPTAYSYFFNEGYYNFCLGLGLYLLALGYWYARRDGLTVARAAALAAVGLVVVWTHLIAFLMLILSIGVVTTAEHALRWWRAGPGDERRRMLAQYLGRAVLLLVVFAPAIALAVGFFDRHGLSEPPELEQGYARRLKHLVAMSHLFTHSPWEVAILAPFLGLLGVLGARAMAAIVRRRGPCAGDAFLALAGVLTVVYLTLPVTTKEVEITQRFLPYILFALMLWTATRPPSPRLAAVTVALVVAVLAGSLGHRVHKFAQYERLIEEYLSATPHVAPGSTVLALHFWRHDMPFRGEWITWRSDPTRHVSSHIARATGGIDLRSYMMAIGYFPVRYRPETDPYRHLGRRLEAVPPELDLTPADGAGPRVDYVLTWAYPNEDLAEDGVRRVMDQIRADYELVYASPDRGLVRLYRRADGAS